MILKLCFFVLITATFVNGTQIILDGNKLNGLDQSFFQSILNYFKANNITAVISVGNSKSD